MKPWSAAALLVALLLLAAGCVGQGPAEDPEATETSQSPTPTPTPTATDRAADTPRPDEELSNYSRGATPAVPADRFVSAETAHRWYLEGNATFVDARPVGSFERSHVDGALPSPATPAYRPDPDPVENLSRDRRVVTYCACPNHLATLRAEQLMDDGYAEVYVLEDGFLEWRERYPDAVETGN